MVLKGLIKPVLVLIVGTVIHFIDTIVPLAVETATQLVVQIKALLLNAQLDSMFETLISQA